MAKLYFSDQELRGIGLSGPMVETLRNIAEFVDTQNEAAAATAALVAANADIASNSDDINTVNNTITTLTANDVALDARIDVLEAAGPYALTGGDTFTGAVDVQALLQCDSFRIDAAPSVSAATASTHKLSFNANGTTYYFLLTNV